MVTVDSHYPIKKALLSLAAQVYSWRKGTQVCALDRKRMVLNRNYGHCSGECQVRVNRRVDGNLNTPVCWESC